MHNQKVTLHLIIAEFNGSWGGVSAHSVGNIVRKVLHLIREEYNAAVEATGATSPPSASIHSTPRPMLRSLSGISTPTTPATPSTPFTLSNFVLLGHPRLHQAALQEAGTRTPQSKPTELLAIPEENSKKSLNVKPALIQAIQEVIDELETVYENVAKNAKDHIHAE